MHARRHANEDEQAKESRMHFDNELLFGRRRAPKIEGGRTRTEGEQPVNFPLYDPSGRTAAGGVDGGRV